MTAKAAPLEEDDPVMRAIDNAPEDPNLFSPEELAEMEARIARGPGQSMSHADVVAMIAERAKREG